MKLIKTPPKALKNVYDADFKLTDTVVSEYPITLINSPKSSIEAIVNSIVTFLSSRIVVPIFQASKGAKITL